MARHTLSRTARRGAATRASIVGLLVALVGCAEEPVAAEFVTETRHFDVIEYPGAPLLCGGEFDKIDAMVDQARAEVEYAGITERAQLHVWPIGSDDVPCAGRAAGCYLVEPHEVHLRYPGSLPHEVVHAAITSQLASFYSEGLAEGLSTSWLPESFVPFDPRPLLSGKPKTHFEYWQAALFVSFMIDTFGPSAAYQAMLGASEGDANEAFVRWTGQSLDESVASFMAADRVCSPALLRCAAEPTPLPANNTWVFSTPVACASSETFGVEGGEYHIETLLLPSAGEYRFEVEHATVVLESCSPCSQRSAVRVGGEAEVDVVVSLEAGPHTLFIQPNLVEGSTTDVRLTLQN